MKVIILILLTTTAMAYGKVIFEKKDKKGMTVVLLEEEGSKNKIMRYTTKDKKGNLTISEWSSKAPIKYSVEKTNFTQRVITKYFNPIKKGFKGPKGKSHLKPSDFLKMKEKIFLETEIVEKVYEWDSTKKKFVLKNTNKKKYSLDGHH